MYVYAPEALELRSVLGCVTEPSVRTHESVFQNGGQVESKLRRVRYASSLSYVIRYNVRYAVTDAALGVSSRLSIVVCNRRRLRAKLKAQRCHETSLKRSALIPLAFP